MKTSLYEGFPDAIQTEISLSLEEKSMPGQINQWPGKVSRADKSLACKVILEKISWAEQCLAGNVSWAEESLPRKVFWEQLSSWERFPGQRFICPEKVFLLGKVSQAQCAECKIKKLFPEPVIMGNFSRMEYPRILRNIHPWHRWLP